MRLSPERPALVVGGFRLRPKGRFWQVFDPQGRLVVTSVYKKGGLEVVRRLLPPGQAHLADAVCRKRLSRKTPPPTAYAPAGHAEEG